MIIEYGWSIWICLDSEAASTRRGARQRCYSGHDLQREWNITVNLRSSRNGRNIDAAPTDVVQQIVSHAEAGANARLAFPKRVPGQGRTRPKESRGAIFCKQRLANSGLREQDPVRSLSETGGRVIVGMVAV